jgi:WD40 repeat protein
VSRSHYASMLRTPVIRVLLAATLTGMLLWLYLPPVAPGCVRHTLKCPEAGPAMNVFFSPDGNLVGIISNPGFRLWRVATGREVPLPDVEGHPVAFTPDGRILAVVVRETMVSGQLLVWDLAEGRMRERRPIAIPNTPTGVLGLFFATDGSVWGMGFKGDDLVSWDTAGDGRERVLWKSDGRKTSYPFSRFGTRLVTTQAGILTVEDVRTGQVDARITVTGLAHPDEWDAMSANGNTVIALAGTSGILDLQTGVCRGLNVPGFDLCVAVSADGQSLALRREQESRRDWLPQWLLPWIPRRLQPGPGIDPWSFDAAIYDLRQERIVGSLSGVSDIAYSPAGRLLAVARKEHTVQLWDLEPPAPWLRILGGAACAALLAWWGPAWFAWLGRRTGRPRPAANLGLVAEPEAHQP